MNAAVDIKRIQTSIGQCHKLLQDVLPTRVVPFLHGSPGIGKSAVIAAVAKHFNLKVIDLRLSQCDPTDLMGFPHVYTDAAGNRRATYVPMDVFPVEGDPIPDGYDGWLLVLDEMNGADRATTKAAYKVVLDRMVGQANLHPNVVIVAAGNRATDGALIEDMGTAMQSRLMHIDTHLVPSEWIDWATHAGIDHRITSYIRHKPDQLYTFDPNHTDYTFACPRTWDFADRTLKELDLHNNHSLAALAGCVSEGVARNFLAFSKIYDQVPTMDEILHSPKSSVVPTNPAGLYAVSGAIAASADTNNIATLVNYIERMPPEFHMVTLRDATQRNSSLFNAKEIQKWAREFRKEYT